MLRHRKDLRLLIENQGRDLKLTNTHITVVCCPRLIALTSLPKYFTDFLWYPHYPRIFLLLWQHLVVRDPFLCLSNLTNLILLEFCTLSPYHGVLSPLTPAPVREVYLILGNKVKSDQILVKKNDGSRQKSIPANFNARLSLPGQDVRLEEQEGREGAEVHRPSGEASQARR